MKSSVAYLVILMVMLAACAVFRMNPPTFLHQPANLALAAVLLLGAAGVAARRPWSYAAGLVAAGATSLFGLLALLGRIDVLVPMPPAIWVVAGLYLAFRLSLNQHINAEKAEGKRPRRSLGLDLPQDQDDDQRPGGEARP